MNDIVKTLEKINQHDLFDWITAFIPIFLSIIVIVQTVINNKKSEKLYNEIHTRDENLKREIMIREQWAKNQDNILLLYSTYYEFCDIIFTSGFANEVCRGNVNYANACLYNLNILRGNLEKRLDLARLMFEKNEYEVYEIIEKRFNLGIIIINKYFDYVINGRLIEVSQNAWNSLNIANPMLKGNYSALNKEQNNNIIKLCKEKEIIEIEKKLDEYIKLHEYDQYDIYFERFMVLDDFNKHP